MREYVGKHFKPGVLGECKAPLMIDATAGRVPVQCQLIEGHSGMHYTQLMWGP